MKCKFNVKLYSSDNLNFYHLILRTICETIYRNQMIAYRSIGCINVELRAPPVASALRWVHQISSRISTPIKSFQALQHPIVQTEDAQMLLLRFNNLMDKLRKFEKDIFQKWSDNAPQTIESNLMKSLLARVENSKLITLNFNPALSAILREVHYLRLMHKSDIPKCAIAFSEEQETYRGYILNLEKSVEWYNNVRVNLLNLIAFLMKFPFFRYAVIAQVLR